MSATSTESQFKQSWSANNAENLYTHWTPGEPANQIQLAFRNHWTLFQQLLQQSSGFNGGKRSLEVGCGRGSLSAYFANGGYDATVLDISESVIDIAKQIFARNQLAVNAVVGDARALPFADGSFDTVFSIGLFEHFEDPEPFLAEQVRILDKGGMFFAYVVPHYTENVQKEFAWINDVLKGYVQHQPQTPKQALYRSDADSSAYLPLMERYGLTEIQHSGVYPLPMISHSIDFPFSLMPEPSEAAIVAHFNQQLAERAQVTGKHPWLCDEGFGQAYLVWGVKG